MLKNQVVKDYILNAIKQLRPNDRIPSRQALCRKLGFSRSTIDTAISELIRDGVLYAANGSGTFVSEEYRSNIRPLREGIVSWGVILPDMVKDIYPQFIRGVEDYCQERNINVVVCNTDNDIPKQNHYALRLLESGIAGIILIPAIASERDISGLQAVANHNIPIVFCNRAEDSMPDAPLVCSNDFYGGYIATKHLIQKGYHTIAYAAQKRYKASLDRYFGYAAALLEHQYKIEQDHVLIGPVRQGGSDGDLLHAGAMRLLKGEHPPDAFFCFNDRTSLSVYRAIRDCGLRISQDVGLMAYDNSSLCEALEVKLTTIYFRSYDMGQKAAEILDNEIHGKHLKGHRVFVFQPELIVRESCLGKERKE